MFEYTGEGAPPYDPFEALWDLIRGRDEIDHSRHQLEGSNGGVVNTPPFAGSPLSQADHGVDDDAFLRRHRKNLYHSGTRALSPHPVNISTRLQKSCPLPRLRRASKLHLRLSVPPSNTR